MFCLFFFSYFIAEKRNKIDNVLNHGEIILILTHSLSLSLPPQLNSIAKIARQPQKSIKSGERVDKTMIINTKLQRENENENNVAYN